MNRQLDQLHSEPSGQQEVLRQFPEGHSKHALLFEAESGLGKSTSEAIDDQLRIHEYERQRMGQELHDSAGQLLVSLQFSVAHLRRVEGDHGHAELFDEIQDTVRQIEQEIRSLAFLHYPVELGERGLSAAVQSLTRGFGRRTGIRTSFKVSGDQSAVSEPVANGLLRVAQEALVNIHRHAHASHARVLLKQLAQRVELVISDDGVGIPLADDNRKVRGVGLKGMRYRIEALGGRFSIRNLKRGTRICASVPAGLNGYA